MEKHGLTGLFHTHGYLCASHPVEVLLLCITGTVCLLTLSIYDATHAGSLDATMVVSAQYGKVPLPTGIHVHISATSYFLALLCIFLQCKKLLNTGSKYLVGIVSVFSLFSCVVYTSIVGNIFGGDIAILREALPLFFLLNDFMTVSSMAKFALLSKSSEEAPSKIAQGVSTLGPSVSLNTLVGALVIGVGTLSGVKELETASRFGCLALLTHYFIFMTFLPACLSLFLELCDRGTNQPYWLQDQSTDVHEHAPNPLLQHVKLIMSAGLMFVHVHSRLIKPDASSSTGEPHPPDGEDWLARFLAVNAEHVLAVVLALLVATKYLYLEKDDTMQLLEPQGTEKTTTASATLTYAKKDEPERPIIIRKRRSTFTIGDDLSLSEEISQSDNSIDKQLRDPCELNTKFPDLLVTNPSGIENYELKANPLKRNSLSFPGQSFRLKSLYSGKTTHNPSFIEKYTQGHSPTMRTKSNHEKHTVPVESPMKSKYNLEASTLPAETYMKSKYNHEGHTLQSETSMKSKCNDEAHTLPAVTAALPTCDRKTCPEGVRSLEECKRVMKESDGVFCLTDEELCILVEDKVILGYQLESVLKNMTRAVSIRRKVTARKLNRTSEVLSDLPYDHYDYTLVSGACCENVIGYMPVPVGVAGPLLLDGKQFFVPMATTEGCLVASTNRGCSALMKSGGVKSSIIGNGMTRGPVMRLPSAMQASEVKQWLEEEEHFLEMKEIFDSTSRFARLMSIKCAVAGRLLFARFVATTGDAMGMNMLSKGTEKALNYLQDKFHSMEIMSLSGNYCTDKKATAINWIEGRGKSVVCEAIVPGHVVTKVLKTSVTALTELNISKNLVGSAMAGAIGGFNAHAANIVTALFIATGQDPAQNVASSSCITLMEPCGPTHGDLYISCTMPSIEVGTIGGGTILSPQASCLQMLGVKGPSRVEPGQNAAQLARIVCGTVLAGELSLLSALAAGHLVRSHLKHNRSTINLMSADDCAVL